MRAAARRLGALAAGLASLATCAPETRTLSGDEDAPSVSTEPASPAALLRERAEEEDGPGAGELDRLLGEVVALREGMAGEARQRDVLLARVAELEADRRAGLPRAFLARWRLRAARAELERVVVRLQRRQAALLAIEARRQVLAEVEADRQWERLEEQLQQAAAAWEAGGVDPAVADTALLLALERAGEAPREPSMGRYRALVTQLARVNERLNGTISARRRATPAASQPRATEFLGVEDRGATMGDREAFLRLRRELADEIVAVASEVSRRAGGSP